MCIFLFCSLAFVFYNGHFGAQSDHQLLEPPNLGLRGRPGALLQDRRGRRRDELEHAHVRS